MRDLVFSASPQHQNVLLLLGVLGGTALVSRARRALRCQEL